MTTKGSRYCWGSLWPKLKQTFSFEKCSYHKSGQKLPHRMYAYLWQPKVKTVLQKLVHVQFFDWLLSKNALVIVNIYVRKILLFTRNGKFNNGRPWEKKDNQKGFHVTMGSFDEAESCKLVVADMLSQLQSKYGNYLKMMGLRSSMRHRRKSRK